MWFKTMNKAIIVFGGGCFWCTEAVFRELKGVISVMPGYAGGSTRSIRPQGGEAVESTGSPQAAPTYESICTGKTGHAEVSQIEYDPSEVSLDDLLTVFFATHDPTTLNRQGNDTGTQYRSIILYTMQDQKEEALKFIEKLNDAGSKIVTEVKPLDKFYLAEEYHRQYFNKNPDKAYCQVVINPKLEKLKDKFNKLLKTND